MTEFKSRGMFDPAPQSEGRQRHTTDRTYQRGGFALKQILGALITAVVLSVLGISGVTAATADAHQEGYVYSEASLSQATHQYTASKTKSGSKAVVYQVSSTPATYSKARNSKVTSWEAGEKKAAKVGDSFTITKNGVPFWNTVVKNGKRVWVKDYVGSSDSKAGTISATFIRTKDGFVKGNCKNPAKGFKDKSVKTSLSIDQVVVLKLQTNLLVTDTVTLKGAQSADLHLEAVCKGSSAWLKGHGESMLSSTVKVTIEAKSISEAKSKLTAKAKTGKYAGTSIRSRLEQKLKSDLEAKLQIDAAGKARADIKGEVECKDTEIPPVPVPTVTVTAPVPGPTVTETIKVPQPVVTETVKVPGDKETIYVPQPTVTETIKVPVPAETKIVEVPGPTKTVEVPKPGPTVTETVKVPVPGPTVTETVKVPVPGPTVTVTAPAKEKPGISITEINQVGFGKCTPNTVIRYDVPGNGNAAVTLDAGTGSFRDLSDGGKLTDDGNGTWTVSGSGSVSFTYCAGSDKDLEQGGTDRVTVRIRTSDGLTAETSTTARIDPKPRPGL